MSCVFEDLLFLSTYNIIVGESIDRTIYFNKKIGYKIIGTIGTNLGLLEKKTC